MRHNEGYHRRRSAWQPNERQRQVLDLLLEGRTNAEIAQGLGMTPDGAKWHVSQLLAETGMDDRRALADWWRERRGSLRFGIVPWLSWRWLALATITGLALVGAFPGRSPSGPSGDGGASRESRAILADVGREPEAAPSPTATPDLTACPDGGSDLRAVDPAEVAGEGMEYAGQSFTVNGCPILVANRPDRAFVRVPLGAEVRIGNTDLGGISRSDPPDGIVVDVAGEPVAVRVIPYTAYQGPGMEVEVEAEGENSKRRVAVDGQGGLWIATTALAVDAVFEAWTGEWIDTSNAARLGRLLEGRPASDEWTKPVSTSRPARTAPARCRTVRGLGASRRPLMEVCAALPARRLA